MKRLFFISILFFLFMVSRLAAQAFPDENARWYTYVVATVYDEPYEYTFETVMSNDTIINNIQYNTLIEYTSTPGTIGFVRNEGQKVYRLNTDSMEEELLYDFTLEAGDVFNSWYYVFAVDSVQIEDGTYRKRWELGTLDSTSPLVWIEGIGNKHSILNSTYFPNTIFPQLVCLKESNEIVYSNPKLSVISGELYDCDGLLAVNDEKINKAQIRLAPNPANTYFDVSFADNNTKGIESIVVYDLKGNNIFDTEYERLSTVSINILTWASGLYLVKVNGQFMTKILIQ